MWSRFESGPRINKNSCLDYLVRILKSFVYYWFWANYENKSLTNFFQSLYPISTNNLSNHAQILPLYPGPVYRRWTMLTGKYLTNIIRFFMLCFSHAPCTSVVCTCSTHRHQVHILYITVEQICHTHDTWKYTEVTQNYTDSVSQLLIKKREAKCDKGPGP